MKGIRPNPISILPSNPNYEKINDLWNMYAIVKNPQMFFGEVDLEGYEIKEIEEQLEFLMEQILRQQSINLIHALFSAGFEW